MKKFFGVAIGSIFVYFVLTICRMNLAALNNLFTNNMMKIVLIASFTFVLSFIVCLNIKLERKGLYYREHDYLPSRYLVQVIFWIGIVFNYWTRPLHQMHFQGNILSDLFDIAFLCSFISLLLFGVCAIGKCIRKQKERKSKKRDSGETYFYSDNPVSNNREDKLYRRNFVNHVVSNLYKMKEENLTIGFYGKWGTGKTSIFNMIKKTIENDSDKKNEYLIFEFKPWYFGKDNHEIVVEFLEQLLNEMKKSRGFDSQIEKNITKYSKAFSSVSLRIPGITVNFKETYSLIEELFDAKSKNIKDLKDEVEESLRNSPKRIIVFIDDIDRLNKEEIQMVFRLVRLICDFPNITYIVALDEEIVAAALAELHGKDENFDAKKIGRDYLEKFIQIPLYIPEADVYSMNYMLWSGIREILDENDLFKESEFLNVESSSIKRLIDLQKLGFTPRNINRYLNTVKFMVPLLKGKINIDDLLYLLLIKIGAPGIYEIIKCSPEVFLEASEGEEGNKQFKEITSGYEIILKRLFPNYHVVLNNKNGLVVSSNIEQKKKICSKNYFKRYFMYDVSQSERSLKVFFNDLNSIDLDVLSSKFERHLSLYSIEKTLALVEHNIDGLSMIQKRKLVGVIQNLLSNKREKDDISFYKEEYVRILSLLGMTKNKEDQFNILKTVVVYLIPGVYKILSEYIDGKINISKIVVVERYMAQSAVQILNAELRKYFSNNSFKKIFYKQSVEENSELLLLWDEIESIENKREIVAGWIDNKSNFNKLLELISGRGNRKEKREMDQYSKVLELVGRGIIHKYANTLDRECKTEYPNLYVLTNLHLNIESKISTMLEKIWDQSIDSDSGYVYFSKRKGDTVARLLKYGDRKTKKKIEEYLDKEKDYNENIDRVKEQEMLELEEFLNG